MAASHLDQLHHPSVSWGEATMVSNTVSHIASMICTVWGCSLSLATVAQQHLHSMQVADGLLLQLCAIYGAHGTTCRTGGGFIMHWNAIVGVAS